jgi:hypothetical protein
MKRIKRKVVSYENIRYSIHSHHGGTNLLTLECGHIKRQKGSISVPDYCYCQECEENNLTTE